MTVSDVCVIGFGAIGALYAWALEKSGQARVTAVCRSNYQVVHDIGLDFQSDKLGRTDSPWKPYRVVRTVEEAADRAYTYVLVATKCIPEVRSTPTTLGPLLSYLSSHPTPSTSSTTVVLLQNGVGIEDDLIAYLSATDNLSSQVVVVSGCAWVDATAIDGGKKVTQFGTEKLVLGVHKYDTNHNIVDGAKTLKAFCDVLRSVGAEAVPVDDVDAARWRKVLWNASFSTLCTLTRSTVGQVLYVPSARTELAAIMQEVLIVARASISPMSPTATAALPDTVIQDIIEHENPQSAFKPSMLVDLEAGRPMEVEAIVGGVLRRARMVEVSVPRLELVYAGLCVIQKGLLGN